MKKNSRITLLVMVIGFVLCYAGRLYQILCCTDMTTGFIYYEDSLPGGLVYYVPLVLVLVGMIAAALADCRNNASIARTDTADIVDAKAAVIGFGMLLTGVCAVYGGVEKLSGGYTSAFSYFVDIILGAAITVVAFVTLYKKEFSPGLGFSYVCGALYFMLRGILVFLERMVITTVPEYLIECLIAITAGVFFMLFVKLFSGNSGKRTRAALCAVGGFGAVLCLSSSLATIVAGLIGPEEIASRITSSRAEAFMYYQTHGGRDGYLLTWSPWAFLAVGLLMGAAVIVLGASEKKKPAAESGNSPE